MTPNRTWFCINHGGNSVWFRCQQPPPQEEVSKGNGMRSSYVTFLLKRKAKQNKKPQSSIIFFFRVSFLNHRPKTHLKSMEVLHQKMTTLFQLTPTIPPQTRCHRTEAKGLSERTKPRYLVWIAFVREAFGRWSDSISKCECFPTFTVHVKHNQENWMTQVPASLQRPF